MQENDECKLSPAVKDKNGRNVGFKPSGDFISSFVL